MVPEVCETCTVSRPVSVVVDKHARCLVIETSEVATRPPGLGPECDAQAWLF